MHRENTVQRYEPQWARVISDVVSPPVVWAIMTFPIAFRDAESNTRGILWAAIYVFMVCILPVLYIVWLVKRGHVTDIHLPRRQERIRPFLMTIACSIAVLGLFRLMNVSRTMDFYAMSTLLQVILLALITMIWQISIHTMSISGVVVTIGIWFSGLLALFLIPLVLVVSLARLQLGRHTVPQVVAGAALGGTSVASLMLFMF